MGKLQPNFSWQKYERVKEDSKEQFQFHLQQEHILVANSVNSTIDDLSYWTRERPTSFTWVNGKAIWTETLATATWGGGGTTNTITPAIKLNPMQNFVIIRMEGYITDGTNTLPLPYVGAVLANGIQMKFDGTNIVLTSGGTNYSTYSGYITIYYYKT